jgi:very-short-patch-repair endonuclease
MFENTSASGLKLKIDCISTYSLAAQQNAYPLVRNIQLQYPIPEDSEQSDLPCIRNLAVHMTTPSDFFSKEEWVVDQIQPGQIITLPARPINLSHTLLFEMTEELTLPVDFSVVDAGAPNTCYLKKELSIALLPANYWGGESRQPDLLAAFVKPNGIYVESLVRQVTEVLEQNGHERKTDGYQSNTREKPFLMAAALWNVIVSQKIAYVTPPPGYARQGQRVRLASDISSSRLGACLDLSLLFASCLEAMGLNPVIALCKEHAFVGAWLIDERLPVLANDDPMDLRKRVDSRDIVIFESTLVTNTVPVTFEQSRVFARELLDEEKEDDFVYVVDIKQARARKIKPIFSLEETRKEVEPEKTEGMALSPIPPLPPVRSDEQQRDDTPETRIDTWQRKLLDLTKRNSLLALKDRAVTLKLYCPDIASMEDRLADGSSFSFMPAEESPINDAERDNETFRFQTGSDLHRQYALEQLEKHVLIVNMSRQKFEKNAITLFRKAKNDLEEGGSNTLFLALGMLRWKENPDDDRTYRAPLILIPVELTRKSARAPIKLKQLSNEVPLFNMTLIEFLYREQNIYLNQFRDALPEDESGVDVNLIWDTVRSAISEQPGYEVVEELCLGSFSFAKYLMWKDLKDRIDDLKENPFVKHLVDHPHDAYQQDANFVLQDEVDDKINPENVFTPLNCDSSQLVTVEASGRTQDFVLEGPPGTGKSETIANIISHNMAIGRRVLFVAEKMAALQVVYRRLEKVGLDHLCLELHSNKANKKAVLDQLRVAVEQREEVASKGWVESVRTLKAKRDHLNAYVSALHAKSIFELSVREAISRDVLYKNTHKLDLGWDRGIESAPAPDAARLDVMLQAVRDLAIAYNDVAQVDPGPFAMIKARSWSNAWQTSVISCLKKFDDVVSNLCMSSAILASSFNINLKGASIRDILKIRQLSELIDLAESHSFGFVLKKGAKQNLESLGQLAKLKKELDGYITSIGHGVSPNVLENTPIEGWVERYNATKNSWFKLFFEKIKINGEAKLLGYSKFRDLDILDEIAKAAQVHKQIGATSEAFEEDAIWEGWETPPEKLENSKVACDRAFIDLSHLLKIAEDNAVFLGGVKSQLVDNRDFLHASKAISQNHEVKENIKRYQDLEEEAKGLNIEFILDVPFSEANKHINEVVANEPKLKAWAEWVAAKDTATKFKLNNLVSGLESRIILSEDAEGQVLTAFCRWLAPQLIDQNEVLREFKASSHEQMIVEFRHLDTKVTKTTSAYISAINADKVPNPNSSDAPKEFGILSKELQKKTKHKPVRSLIQEMGTSLLEICPCLMMSPLSVAQFLPSDFNGFDLVVFDEASQMTTWDSVGAIARGKNVIVVGDPKQMPPTNFFQGTVDVDNPDEEDLESILDQALAARLPHLRLKGHYRSRHETLIAFSNSKYYDNSLITYPSSDTKESAVTLHRVNGIYAKGKDRNNPIEAKAVVDEIVQRLRNPSENNKTIGVVTLNTEQQRTIEDLLDDARRQYPEIETFFHSTDDYDGVFVKNLESVQGDERDVIILSLGYGPTESGARTMSMNFGPLNKSGGERRLNVAITRATSEVLLFSSFDSSMIDLSRTSAQAVEDLKHYLEFAEKGPISLAEQTSAKYGVDQFDSDFEEAVARALRDKGWEVQTQVGVSKFRVDLGVRHPEFPGAYLAGVECDGATYHGSSSARDRDRVRQIILENLGWRLIRLWSTDYFQDPAESIDRIDKRLKEILEEDMAQSEKQADSSGVESELSVQESLIPQNEMKSSGKSKNLYDSSAVIENNSADTSDMDDLDAARYFDSDYKVSLSDLAKSILEERNGITLHSLALEIANRHGLSRTSKKQLEHLYSVIKPWVGIKPFKGNSPVVWRSKADIVEEISWRGISPFGYERDWKEIPYPEAIGLAKLAVDKSPLNPVNFICNEFGLKRRHEKTLEEFQSWVDASKMN